MGKMMNNFNLVHNRLLDLNYSTEKNKEIDGIELILYIKEDTTVFLKQLNSINDVTEINKMSHVIKSFTDINNLNLSNSYLILTTEIDINYEDFYLVERNNIFLRKYVVRGISDLERIPFLDNDKFEDSTINNNDIEDLIIESEIQVFDEIKKKDGHFIDLNDDVIKEIAQNIMRRSIQ